MTKLTANQKIKLVGTAAIVGIVGAAAVATTIVYKDSLKTNTGSYVQYLDALIEEQRVFHDRSIEAGLNIIDTIVVKK